MTLSRCPQVTGRIGMRVGLGQPNQDDVAALLSTVLERTPASAERKAARTAVSPRAACTRCAGFWPAPS